MSEYHIPFHIQEEIMKRLPVKSLIRFRCVSKAWKSLIDSSQFIAAHHPQQKHLLVSLEESQYVSYIDHDTFPQQPTLPLPLSFEQMILPRLVGSSCGLVCLCGYHPITLIWNPSIRKFIVVDEPALGNVAGFGVCPVTNDPKILSIKESSKDEPEASYKCEVMVYTLSSGKWRSLPTNLPTTQIWNPYYSVVTDGFIYWRAGTPTRSCIMSFDVTNESFQVIDLPDTLARRRPDNFRISKLRESLVILEHRVNMCTTLWMMEHGAQKSLTKLFNITTTISIVGFMKNGVPITIVIEDGDDGNWSNNLLVYEPNSNHNNVLKISRYSRYVDSYMETLLMLGRSDCISY